MSGPQEAPMTLPVEVTPACTACGAMWTRSNDAELLALRVENERLRRATEEQERTIRVLGLANETLGRYWREAAERADRILTVAEAARGLSAKYATSGDPLFVLLRAELRALDGGGT